MKTRIGVLIVLPSVVSALALILSTDGESFQKGYGMPSNMLPRLPCGRAMKLVTSPNSGILGTTIWPAASSLCSHLSQKENSLAGKHVLEVGSGTGAVGLYAAALGAASVTLTDCRPPPDSAMYTTDGKSKLPETGSDAILQLLRENVQVNRDLFDGPSAVKVLELDWTSKDDISRVAEAGPVGGFDVVLASDVTHFTSMHKPLASTIAALLNTDGECLLSHQQRMVTVGGKDMQLTAFERMARSLDLDAEYLDTADGANSMLRLWHEKDDRISLLTL